MGCRRMADISFDHLPDKKIPDRGEIRTEQMTEDIEKKLTKQQLEKQIKTDAGLEPEKVVKGSFTKDVPQLLFRFGAAAIPCPKFNLTDEEAQTFATHLNILLPLEGKLASIVVIVMITLNKVYQCMDAIQARSKPKLANDAPGFEEKPQEPEKKPNEVI
jgi:hypothetical protein